MAHIGDNSQFDEMREEARIIAQQLEALDFKDLNGRRISWYPHVSGGGANYVVAMIYDAPAKEGFDPESAEETVRDITGALAVMGITFRQRVYPQHHRPNYQALTNELPFWLIKIHPSEIDLAVLERWVAPRITETPAPASPQPQKLTP